MFSLTILSPRHLDIFNSISTNLVYIGKTKSLVLCTGRTNSYHQSIDTGQTLSSLNNVSNRWHKHWHLVLIISKMKIQHWNCTTCEDLSEKDYSIHIYAYLDCLFLWHISNVGTHCNNKRKTFTLTIQYSKPFVLVTPMRRYPLIRESFWKICPMLTFKEDVTIFEILRGSWKNNLTNIFYLNTIVTEQYLTEHNSTWTPFHLSSILVLITKVLLHTNRGEGQT